MSKVTRLAQAEPQSNVIPLVAPKRADHRIAWIAGAVLAVAAILLFLVLDGRRRALTAPSTTVPAAGSNREISAPPELVIPQGLEDDFYPVDRAPVFQVEAPRPQVGTALRRYAVPAPVPSVVSPYGQTAALSAPAPVEPNPMRYAAPPEPPAFLNPGAGADPAQEVPGVGQRAGGGRERVYAGLLNNPSTTVPLGTIIPAVLETALDSTRPGAVRAIVSRDVGGFDGSRTLIPRGSRLYGEYGAELAPGQNRTLIRWIRLIRPDGALIALDSPVSDPLGRAGVEGKVNSKFLERFGEALLQSTLDIGVGVATRSIAGNPLVFASPGSNQQVAARSDRQVQRTLKVRQGTSVSVFVARDLDFTTVEN